MASRTNKKSAAKKRSRDAAQRNARTAYLATKDDTAIRRYWHGGRAGLKPGTILLGRAEAEIEGINLDQYDMQRGYGLGVTSPHRVYFTSDREFARGFAARIQGRDTVTGIVVEQGTLYEVEPLGDVERDPDFHGNVSWCAPQARILSVAERNVRLDAYQINERIGPYSGWTDRSPIYTASGHYMPSPEQRQAGFQHLLFDVLYPWAPLEFINPWIAGLRSGDRPSAELHGGVHTEASEGGEVLIHHVERAKRLLGLGIEFSDDPRPHIARINQLLGEHHTRVQPNDTRGVVVAKHPTEGVIGAMIFTGAQFDDRVGMMIDAVVVDKSWRQRGVGSVLLLTAQQILPGAPTFAAGHCAPALAPFFAQAGYTVLNPGVALPFPLGKEVSVLDVGGEECWFFRQGPV